MDAENMSDAEVTLRLALLKRAATAGSEGAVLKTLADMNGHKTIMLYESFDRFGRAVPESAGPVTVIVDRVRSVGPDWRGGTVLAFDLPDHHPKARLVTNLEPNKVVRNLREKGWKY